jgi:REP element-mobilizing transposase RayT
VPSLSVVSNDNFRSGASLRWADEGVCPYMDRAMPTAFYRRNLPHLQRDFKPHFLTFCSYHRWVLPACARTIVLNCCLHEHQDTIDLNVVVVMPDHVHLIFTPLVHKATSEVVSLARVTKAIKGASAHLVNRCLGRSGTVWQEESFDRVLRCSEKLDEKVEYILNNPVRRGLVVHHEDYPWLWVAPANTAAAW